MFSTVLGLDPERLHATRARRRGVVLPRRRPARYVRAVVHPATMTRLGRFSAVVVCLLPTVIGCGAAGALLAAPAGPALHEWQARTVERHFAARGRPGFRVERVRRRDGDTVEVCWSEPGYLGDGERDYGCDLVELRGRQWWLRDASRGDTWRRLL